MYAIGHSKYGFVLAGGLQQATAEIANMNESER